MEGLGFRQFKSFNLSLVGKNWCRIMSQPESLLGPVFKVVYFPNSSIFQDKTRISAELHMVKYPPFRLDLEKGVMWNVGNGNN